MSRLIPGKAPMADEERKLRHTGDGKLIITECRGQQMLMLVRDNRLLYACVPEAVSDKKGAVYLGKVKKRLRNLNACFVEIAAGELVYLSLEEGQLPLLTNRSRDGRVLEGDEFPVQIIRDAQKTKQAAATVKISLSGRYVVCTIDEVHPGIHFSQKLTAGDRDRLLTLLQSNKVLQNHRESRSHIESQSHKMTENVQSALSEGKICSEQLKLDVDDSESDGSRISVILRTEAAGATEEDILGELKSLVDQLSQILFSAAHRTCFSCLLPAPSPVISGLLELISNGECAEVVTDSREIYDEVEDTCRRQGISLRLYQDTSYSLAKLYSLETKLDGALSRQVWLKSGGYLIIDVTEAMIVIDVNSGKYSGKKPQEEAFLLINREAAEEIALQLRLRNLSGMILVDFINMDSADHKDELLHLMRKLVASDPVKTTVIDFTRLGLMEITRKKISKSLYEQIHR